MSEEVDFVFQNSFPHCFSYTLWASINFNGSSCKEKCNVLSAYLQTSYNPAVVPTSPLQGVRIWGDCNLPSTKNHMRSLALSPSSKKNLLGKTFFWTVHQVVSQQNPDFWIDMLFWKMVGKTVAIKPRWTCTEVIASGKWSLSQNTSREGQKWLHWIGIKICLRMRKKKNPVNIPKFLQENCLLTTSPFLSYQYVHKNLEKTWENMVFSLFFCVHFCFGQRMCQRLPLSFMQHLAASEAPTKEGIP